MDALFALSISELVRDLFLLVALKEKKKKGRKSLYQAFCPFSILKIRKYSVIVHSRNSVVKFKV